MPLPDKLKLVQSLMAQGRARAENLNDQVLSWHQVARLRTYGLRNLLIPASPARAATSL
jgi:hypothetical protein